MKRILAAAIIAALPLTAAAQAQPAALVIDAGYTQISQADFAAEYVVLAKGKKKGNRGGGRDRSRSIGKKLQQNHKINPTYGSKKSYGTVFVKRPDYSHQRVTRSNDQRTPFFLRGLFAFN